MTVRQAGASLAHLSVGIVLGALATIAAFQGQLSRLDERTALMSAQLADVQQRLRRDDAPRVSQGGDRGITR